MIKPMPEIKGAVTFHSDDHPRTRLLKGNMRKNILLRRGAGVFPHKTFLFQIDI
jgi:hypothetical protein